MTKTFAALVAVLFATSMGLCAKDAPKSGKRPDFKKIDARIMICVGDAAPKTTDELKSHFVSLGVPLDHFVEPGPACHVPADQTGKNILRVTMSHPHEMDTVQESGSSYGSTGSYSGGGSWSRNQKYWTVDWGITLLRADGTFLKVAWTSRAFPAGSQSNSGGSNGNGFGNYGSWSADTSVNSAIGQSISYGAKKLVSDGWFIGAAEEIEAAFANAPAVKVIVAPARTDEPTKIEPPKAMQQLTPAEKINAEANEKMAEAKKLEADTKAAKAEAKEKDAAEKRLAKAQAALDKAKKEVGQ